MNELLKIMYVDDEADIRTIVQFALEDEQDFELRICASGQEALEALGGYRPDLVLLDVMMPGMDGPTTLQRLREQSDWARLPIAFVTAKVQPQEVAHLKAIGAIDVIAKPFDPMSWPIRCAIFGKASHMSEKEQPKKLAKLGALRAAFAAALPVRVEAIEACWRTACAATVWGDAHAELTHLAHSLAGSAGTFGFRRLGEQAKTLEEILVLISRSTNQYNFQQETRITELVNALRSSALTGPDEGGEAFFVDASANSDVMIMPTNHRIVLIEDDALLAQEMATQLSTFGWDLSVFSNATDALTAIKEPWPAAVIIDLMLPEGPSGWPRSNGENPVPLWRNRSPCSRFHLQRLGISPGRRSLRGSCLSSQASRYLCPGGTT